jgi:hypothetical protein
MKKILVALSFLALSACSSVEGVIRDKSTGTPIPSANITIKRSSTITDAYGHYKLVGPFIPGDTVMVNAPGYNIFTRSITSTKEIVDIDLSPK